MNYLTFDPYREFHALQHRHLGGTPARRERDEELSLGAWIPPVDIEEDNEKLVLTAELPGFKEDQIDLQVEGGVLTIRGERTFEDKQDGKNFHRVERSYGQFVRSFTLPNNVDRDNVKASFKDGLLSIELPKREEAKPRQIKVSGGNGGSKKEAINVKR
ncbi:MAG TPA: Hsp20/alpha crystallin family protein [Thermoanaerobaculia bacterium]|nr:Hsp20/alpha crystallin family protein [Thermoanaerobaculia bacterium]